MSHPGSRKQNLDRRFDQTQLRESGHGKVVHRDYAAHFFRWGFATRWVKKDMRVLDIGCGQDLPLAYTLAKSMSHLPSLYVGVDLNNVSRQGPGWAHIKSKFNFIDDHTKLFMEERVGERRFDVITCFEVIEHMHPDDGRKLLEAIKYCLADGGCALLSTPVYNLRKMAANHIHEYTIDELRTLIESIPLSIRQRHGTFASWNDLKKCITEQERRLYEELHEYYSHDVLSCFLAPKYPDASRNNIWVLEKPDHPAPNPEMPE